MGFGLEQAVAGIFMFFIFLTDIMFYNDSSFMFDPDPEVRSRVVGVGE